MPVMFNNIPHNIRVPLFYAEFNPGGTPYQAIARLLLIGQMREDRATVTITEASPGVVSWTGHPLSIGSRIRFTTTDTLPTNIVAGTWYYVIATGFTANSFQISATKGGAAIDTTGAVQAGTHTGHGLLGIVPDEVPLLMQDGQEDGFFGKDSMLAMMYKTARDNAPFQEIWCLPLLDDDAGVAATGTIKIDGAAVTTAHTGTVYIAGERVRWAIGATDTNDQIASKLATEINAADGLPVVASVSTDTVTLTARHLGALGNKIRINTDLLGGEDETIKAKMVITAMSGGAGDPDIANALDNLGDNEFDWIAAPYTDATNLSNINDLLNDEAGRWSPIKMLYGHYLTALDDTLANLSTKGNGLNDQHISIMGYYNSPSPPWIWAAAMGGQTAKHLQAAPELSRPLQTLDLRNVVAPKLEDRFNVQERQVLYYDGIASFHVERDGTVSIDRLVTTYQFNEWGSPDATWLDVETMAQSMFGVRYLRQKIENTHGRQSLADENPFGIQGMATADDVRDTIVHGYAELTRLGVFENVDLFERDLVVERPIDDANRLDVYMPLDHVNQLRIIAANMTSYMQRRSAVEEVIGLA